MDDDGLDTPNCPTDLTPMEAEERGGAVVWVCSDCGLVRM